MGERGAVAWALGLAPLLAWDAWLVRSGRPSLSAHAGAHRGVTAVALGYLGAHLLVGERAPERLRSLDPLHAIGRRLAREVP